MSFLVSKTNFFNNGIGDLCVIIKAAVAIIKPKVLKSTFVGNFTSRMLLVERSKKRQIVIAKL